MSLGSTFQKINFLRDLNADYVGMGRTYFPGLDIVNCDDSEKKLNKPLTLILVKDTKALNNSSGQPDLECL